MELNERLELIKQVGEEIVTEEELAKLLSEKETFVAYDGFEPSGRIHIAQGLVRAINISKMIKAGAKFKVLLADWHAQANHKYGGDLQKIKDAGEYFIEVWKASGLDVSGVEFIWASDLVKQPNYWETVMKIEIHNNLPRVLRTVEIMGRSESDSLTASQIIYPLMQAADIFILGADVCQLGMDQRKVNMLARETSESLGFKKPLIVSHHMMLGLLPPTDKEENEDATSRGIRLKMSKSKPDSAIFMTDSVDDVNRKIRNAWCPEGVIIENPILEYTKYVVFNMEEKMLIERPEKFGGNIEYSSYTDLEKDFADKKLFPLDLKNSLASYINKYLEPVRKHFEENAHAKELKEKVESYTVTR